MRASLVLASFGLAFNVLLWSVPAFVGAATIPHALFPETEPSLSETLRNAERTAGPTPSLSDALIQLIGAESEAMHVAGVALQPGPPTDLGVQADRAGAGVQSALATYLRSAQAVVDHLPTR